jgi:hypothetical protein
MIIKGPSAADLNAEVRRIFGKCIPLLEAKRDQVWNEMQKTWPVASGTSLASFEKGLELNTPKLAVAAIIRSDLPAVRYIKSSKKNKWANRTRWRAPLQTDIRRPITLVGRAVREEARALLEAELTRYFARSPR